MELVVIFLIGLFIFFAKLTRPQNNPPGPLASASQKISRHGCRCYENNLNDFERRVVRVLAGSLDYHDYYIFNNLMLENYFHGSTQIDHIVISKFGVFVIESKGVTGIAYADSKRKHWSVYKKDREDKIYNPLRQNYNHIKCVNRKLGIPINCYIDLVVVPEDLQFKNGKIDKVLCITEVSDYIHSFKSILLSDREVSLAVGVLSMVCQTVDVTPEEHIQNVKKIIELYKSPA